MGKLLLLLHCHGIDSSTRGTRKCASSSCALAAAYIVLACSRNDLRTRRALLLACDHWQARFILQSATNTTHAHPQPPPPHLKTACRARQMHPQHYQERPRPHKWRRDSIHQGRREGHIQKERAATVGEGVHHPIHQHPVYIARSGRWTLRVGHSRRRSTRS